MKRWIRIVSINIGLLLVLGIVAELVFGTWLSSDPLDRVNIQRGLTLKVDARGLYPDGGILTYRRNMWGFRGDAEDPATIKILTIGGSTTNQLYLAEDATWQSVLERQLKAQGRPMKVANAGMEGQSTIGHLYSMDAWFPHVPRLKPKYILAYIGINDTVVGSTTDRLAYTNLNRQIRTNSALLNLAKTIHGNFVARIERLTHFPINYEHAEWTDRANYPDNRSAHPHSDSTAYRLRLLDLVDRIRAFGSEPIFVTQVRGDFLVVDGKVIGLVNKSGMNGVDQWRLLEEFNTVTRGVCASENIICFDAARDISYEIGDFYDVVHNSPKGAEKIGRFLADGIAKLD